MSFLFPSYQKNGRSYQNNGGPDAGDAVDVVGDGFEDPENAAPAYDYGRNPNNLLA